MTTDLHRRKILLRCWLLAGLVSGGLCLNLPALLAAQPAERGQPENLPAKAAQGGLLGKADGIPRVGRMFKITLPITGQTTDRVRQSVLKTLDGLKDERVRPVLIFEFSVPKGQSEYGRGSKFGYAYELADFLSGETLGGTSTVAYVPASIQGHAVLPVLACDVIVMAPEAELGLAGVDEKRIDSTIVDSYAEIARRRKKFPAEVAKKLVDASRELLEVETDVGTEYATPEGLAELEKHRATARKTTMFQAGQAARFSGVEARKKGFIDFLATNRLELAQALGLPPGSLKEDAALEGQWKAVRVEIKGPLRADVIEKAQRMIREAIHRQGANFLCVSIDSVGGSPTDSVRLASYLASLDPSKVRTVAYIPKEARADAALIAMGCDQVVVHPGAVLGGESDRAFSREEIDQAAAALRSDVTSKKARSWSLPTAMIDPALVVYRCRRGPGEVEYFCDKELKETNELGQPNAWKKGEPATTDGKPLLVKGSEAVEYRLANHEVEDFGRFKDLYGLDSDPTSLQPSWVDVLVDAMASPSLAVLLLVIGGVGLYAELHSPGMGVGAFVATVCFVLFFWSRFLGGTAGWLEVLMFLVGLGCLLLEIFVLPGFGIFGLGGGAMIIASLILASQSFVTPHTPYEAVQFRNSLLMIVAASAGIIMTVSLLNRWLPHTPIFSQMILNPPTEQEQGQRGEASGAESVGLLGARGTALTPLVPSGKARFGQEMADVMTDGEFAPRGAEVEVVQVQGSRIVVRVVQS